MHDELEYIVFIDDVSLLTFQQVEVQLVGANPGIPGGTGSPGREVQLQVTETHIQWRYVGEPTWNNLIARSEIDGEDGEDGRTPELRATETHLQWKYEDDVDWINLIALADLEGADGEDGEDGAAAELRVSGGYLQWKLVTEETWTNLILLSDLEGDPGPPGEAPTFRVDSGWIQWQTPSEGIWYNLIQVSTLEGPQGDQGPAGGPSPVVTTSGNFTASHTTHKNSFLLQSSGNITLPATGTDWDIGDFIEVRRQSGTVSFLPDTGVTLDYNNTLYIATIKNLKDVVAAKVIAADTWALVGPLEDA